MKIEELRTNFALEAAAGIGTQAPELRLPDVKGDLVSLTDLLRDCPGCGHLIGVVGAATAISNSRAYRAVLPQTADLGARLVAISPRLPEQSISPSAATAIIALLPVVASLLAIPVLGEIPLPAEWVAIIVIGMGVRLAARASIRSFRFSEDVEPEGSKP